ncbi:MAG: amidohydrolase [Peptococcaceae bacterium]|nr:amidohydrolase [Peptococcaceae bacterium]
MNIKKEAAELREEMIALRRDFHQHPELGLQEVRTSRIIEDYLKELGLKVRRCTETGVIGVLKGGRPGKTILLRCDIDALPIQEETGLPFSSENPGVMHACGHDGHTALQLITAKLLSRHQTEIKGTVVFLFQMNEEDAGAELMIQAGALEDPKPDTVCGFHLWSPIPTGKIGIVSGPIMASSYYFKLIIHGRGGHGGAPHTAINPIDAAGHVLTAIKTLHTLELDSTKPTVISVCKIHGGTKEIIVPDDVEMEGSIRCLHDGDAEVQRRFRELCTAVCSAYRCTCDIEIKCGNTLLNNDEVMTGVAMRAAEKVVGKENIQTHGVSVMLGDDFAEFSRRIPGVYYFVGTADQKAGSTYEHHNPHFNIDEDSLTIGVEMQAEIVMEYLK